MKKEFDHIEYCLRKSGEKFGWGDFSAWTNSNFEILSDDIQKVTGIALSGRTLRRLTDRRSNNTPQIATKNALAKYIGYTDFHDYLSKNNAKDLIITQPSRFSIFILRFYWVLIILAVFAVIAFIVFFYPSIELELNKSKVVFYSNDMKGTAPHTASFFYDVTKIKSSNIFIDKNFYDHGELIPVKKNMHYFNHTFELPDYYAVKVIANGERLSCVGVHVVTNGWSAIVNNKLYQNINVANDSGYMHIPQEELSTLLPNNDSVVQIGFKNIRDYGLIADNMTFETRFMNNAALGGRGCYDSKVEIINTHGRLAFNFVMPGCDEKILQAEFGDVYLAGEFNNLNTFFQDISYWRVLKIVTKKKRVAVYLDDVQIYSVRYNDVLDDVKGISFTFKGDGAIDYVKLFNENMELVYNDDFTISK